jgi:hypothetical protein
MDIGMFLRHGSMIMPADLSELRARETAAGALGRRT